jgi:hypothetical protein
LVFGGRFSETDDLGSGICLDDVYGGGWNAVATSGAITATLSLATRRLTITSSATYGSYTHFSAHIDVDTSVS